ncbi:MAG: hypothetical protein WCN92_09420, partial [Eubacteriales bacterium]
DKADVVIVNTCSFIDSSKEESISHILEVHQHRGLRKRRQEQKLIVAGCMAQRFAKEPGVVFLDLATKFLAADGSLANAQRSRFVGHSQAV